MASADKPQTAGHGRNAIVAGLLLALGLGWGVWRLADAGLKPADMAPAAWLDGSAGGALNRALRLPAQDTLNTWNASLRYRLLGDLGDQVAMGCPGWLFYRDGLRPRPGVHVFDERVRLMRHWADQLRQRQVQLLVVAVPDKSRIEADRLCGLPASQPMRRVLDDWQRRCRRRACPSSICAPPCPARPNPCSFAPTCT